MEPKNEKRKQLTLDSQSRTLAITCYAEQLPDGERAMFSAVEGADPNKYQIVAIKHDKGTGKEHYHIAVRYVKNPIYVKNFLKMLHVVFRHPEDDALLGDAKRKPLETCGKYESYVTYLLHQTDQAKAEQKVRYDRTDFVTNLSDAEMNEVLEGYTPTKIKLTTKVMATLMDKAYQTGYELGSLENAIKSFGIEKTNMRQDSKLWNSYLKGVEKKERENPYIMRFCIAIAYPAEWDIDDWISSCIDMALNDVEHVTFEYDGQLSYVPASTKALVMTNRDSYSQKEYEEIERLCSPYEYHIGKPFVSGPNPWFGSMIIYAVRTEEVFQDVFSSPDKYVFQCCIDDNKLKVVGYPSNRLPRAMIEQVVHRFETFRDAFNNAAARYDSRIITPDDVDG